MAFFPTAMSFPAILGEFYSAALSSPGFTWQSSPAMTELEVIVLDWLANMLHLPACFQSSTQGGGVIQGSASESTHIAMVVAKERYVHKACAGVSNFEQEQKSAHTRSRLVVLGSEQSHSGIAKAARIAGVRYKSIHTRFEDNLAVTGEGFRLALAECKKENLEPFFLTATLGTTATCAIDDLEAITSINNKAESFPPLWIHVDAAWAGAALILEEYAHLAMPLNHVDSFDVNMHKWLLVNFDCSCMFVRNKRNLTDILSFTPSYLRNAYSDSGLVTDYRDWQVPLGRRFRSLKLWFVIRVYGVNGMKAHIKRHLDLGEKFASWVRGRPDLFRVIAPPAFALTTFTVVLPGNQHSVRVEGHNSLTESQGEARKLASNDVAGYQNALASANAVTREVCRRINISGKIFLTGAEVNGVYAIRVVSANQATNEHSLCSAFEFILKTTEEVLDSIDMNGASFD